MKICALIKYPPIQGGVSAQCYWLSQGLASRGHEVHVVTNAESVEENYRIQLHDDDRALLEQSYAGGGFVTLRNVEATSYRQMHIPQSKLFVSRVASVATDVVRRHQCDVIFSYYLEPYGVAAQLASTWTGRPYVAQHAGSDVGRLMAQPDLGTTYREVFARANGVCTRAPHPFLGMGVDAESLYLSPPFYLPPDWFNSDVPPLDLADHIEQVKAACGDSAFVRIPGAFDASLPTIGIYGKMGEFKGSFDLLAALAKLKRAGRRFNFVALTRGLDMRRYLEAIVEHDLQDCTWVLPFVAHSKVPAFLRACTAVCFLERNFPITGHTPQIPTEILACGAPLILSQEIADKQRYRDQFRDRENILLVSDPRDHGALADACQFAIDHPDAVRELGVAGGHIDRRGVNFSAYVDGYESILTDVVARAAGKPTTIEPVRRGLPENRRQAIERFAPALVRALNGDADTVIAAFEDQTSAQSGPMEEAAHFCDFVSSWSASRDDVDYFADAVRFAKAILWLGTFKLEEAMQGRFDRRDDGESDSGRFAQQHPHASNWLRVERFENLPAVLRGDDESGPAWFVFHKLLNMRGRHFRINQWSATLLEACDGSRSVRDIVTDLIAHSDVPKPAASKRVTDAIRDLYLRGLIIMAEHR